MRYLRLHQRILFVVVVALVLAQVIVGIIGYAHAPSEIATHFNAAGEADAFGGKGMILFMLIMGVVVSGLTAGLACIPNLKPNLPVKLTAENAFRVMSATRDMCLCLSLFLGIVFLYMTVRTAWGYASLGKWFLPVMIVGTLGLTIFFIGKIVSASKAR